MNIIEKIREITKEEVKEVNNKPVDTLGQVTHCPPGGESFCTFVGDPKYVEDLHGNLRMIITTEEIANEMKDKREVGLAIVSDPTETFFRLHNGLLGDEEYGRAKEPNRIDESARIGSGAHIAPNNVTIGKDVVIEENVVIRENTVIGDGSVIRAGVIIGGEGFEFKREGKRIMGVRHGGGVVIGENVEIQYNSCVDKALYPWDNTVISDYTKLDDMVYVAHGVKIGESVMVASHSTIGGRVVIGPYTWVGFDVTIRNGITIGEDCKVNMGSVVTKDVKDGCAVSGNFAIDHNKFIENIKNSL